MNARRLPWYLDTQLSAVDRAFECWQAADRALQDTVRNVVKAYILVPLVFVVDESGEFHKVDTDPLPMSVRSLMEMQAQTVARAKERFYELRDLTSESR